MFVRYQRSLIINELLNHNIKGNPWKTRKDHFYNLTEDSETMSMIYLQAKISDIYPSLNKKIMHTKMMVVLFLPLHKGVRPESE